MTSTPSGRLRRYRRRWLQVIRINTDRQGFIINYRLFLAGPNFGESLEFGHTSSYKAHGGTGREFKGPENAYVRYIGAAGRSALQVAVFEPPDEITPLTAPPTPGAPHPLSIAELNATGGLRLASTDIPDVLGISAGRPISPHA